MFLYYVMLFVLFIAKYGVILEPIIQQLQNIEPFLWLHTLCTTIKIPKIIATGTSAGIGIRNLHILLYQSLLLALLLYIVEVPHSRNKA